MREMLGPFCMYLKVYIVPKKDRLYGRKASEAI